jgi:hypothetical protein
MVAEADQPLMAEARDGVMVAELDQPTMAQAHDGGMVAEADQSMDGGGSAALDPQSAAATEGGGAAETEGAAQVRFRCDRFLPHRRHGIQGDQGRGRV